MSNERATKEITTSGGHKIVLLEYITGRELQELARESDKLSTGKSDTESKIESGNLAMKMLIKSFDGETENILDKVLELPFTEYSEINEACKELLEPIKK